jgi:hypothetical protein
MAWRLAVGFRCFISGITTCSKNPASRSAGTVYMRRCRASTPKRGNAAANRATPSATSS